VVDEHERLREDVAAYAVDALDPPERVRVEAHLRDCPECSRLHDEYRQVFELLPHGLAPQAPPPSAREALLARVHGERPATAESRLAETPERPDEPAERRPSRLRQLLRPLRWTAVAAALLTGVLLVSLLQGPGPHPSLGTGILAQMPGGRVLSLAGTGASGATARLYIVNNGQHAELAVTGLPPLPPSRIYQLWFARPGQPTITGGPFQVDATGHAVAPVTIPAPLQQVSQIAITEEPAPSSSSPTGPHLLDWFPNS